MNFVHKKITVTLVLFFFIGCVHSKDHAKIKYPIKLCEKARLGELDTRDVSTESPQINAYLLGCSVDVVITEISLVSGPSKGNQNIKKNKQLVADYFFNSELDIRYKNDDGDNLLMLIINSFLPNTWKENAVKKLINKGIDLKDKNMNGDTALDIAKFKGNKRIIDLVSF